jgi:hypothetical protein
MRWLLIVPLLLTSASWASEPSAPPRPQGIAAGATSAPPRPLQPIAADPASLCETAAISAEYAARLPPRLLMAISLTETGRIDSASGQARPWPWTINAEGVGQFFQTRLQAVTAVRALQARGVQSIDIGCMQVNLMYHPTAFASLEEAFDPRANAVYAARFLNTLYAGARNWARAIAAYHSETPALGEAYRLLVMARWQNVAPLPAAPRDTTAQYKDFAPHTQVYGAFAPSGLVYRAFGSPVR